MQKHKKTVHCLTSLLLAALLILSPVTANAASANTSRIGGVSITGLPYVGQVLTAVLDPADAEATYQWVRREARDGTWTTIEGATAAAYTITDSDLGANVFVWATGTGSSFGTVRSGGTPLIKSADSYTAVTGVSLEPEEITLALGTTGTLTAVVAPANASIKYVQWASSDESVVTVSETGVITGLKTGSATITVTTIDGGFTAACNVTVIDAVPVTGVSLTPATIGLTVGETATLAAEVAPANAANKAVEWKSSDESIVRVSANGLITALKAGTAVITVTTIDGGYTAACTVTVTSSSEPGPGTTSPGTTRPGTTTPNKPGTTTPETPDPGDTTPPTDTDPGTGLVTETTEQPDGTIITTVTDPEGGTAETVISPNKDMVITVTDPTGEVLVNVTLPAVIPEPEARFADVPANHWADKAIHELSALGIVGGVGDSQYNMNAPMTRGMLATVLFRMSNGGTDYALNFKDVDPSKWYADGIAWAARTNVVSGISDDMFAPENPITREQLAVMLYRYAALLKLDTTANAGALNAFADGADTHSWAVDGMAWCVGNGILQGKGSNGLDPQANVTRAEVAVMLQRFIENLK